MYMAYLEEHLITNLATSENQSAQTIGFKCAKNKYNTKKITLNSWKIAQIFTDLSFETPFFQNIRNK